MAGNFNSGRKPDSAENHRLRGSYRRDRHAKLERDNAPTVAPPPIEPFPWLDDTARQFWAENGPELQRLGILDHLSVMLFAVLCSQWSMWRKVNDLMKDAELTIETPRGGEVANPLAKVFDTLTKSVFKLSEAFGMSPLGRRKLGIRTSLQVVEADDDPLAQYDLGGVPTRKRHAADTAEILGFDPEATA